MNTATRYRIATVLCIFLFLCGLPVSVITANADDGEQPLYVGWASADITPEGPVNLVGQMHPRIARTVMDPLTATVLALETRGDDGSTEQAIMVSCDVLKTRKAVQEELQRRIKPKLKDFDASKLFLNATHTHTAPGFVDGTYKGRYKIDEAEGVMKPSAYAEFFLERVSKAVVEAWEKRRQAGMSWALGHAVIGLNRRAHYFDGTTAMYGKTDREDFSNIEGGEDHGVEMLFFWDEDKKLTGIVVNVACPSQETEGLSEVSADFWHDVREELRRRYSSDLYVLAQCGAAGDISPHRMVRKKAEESMRQKRGLTFRQEIARRIANTVDEVYPVAEREIQDKTIFNHEVVHLNIPPHEPFTPPFYETDSVQSAELHLIRLGDIALATNPFELYIDYGIRIKSRSRAALTFLVQLSSQNSGYLPTERAIQGGGYSAVKFVVGPEGGKVLVNETVARINTMWE